MYPTIKSVLHIGDYRLLLGFDTGEIGLIDLAKDVASGNGVFRPLANIDYFKQVQVDTESGTIVWPNGVDLDPIRLYEDSTRMPNDTIAAFALTNSGASLSGASSIKFETDDLINAQNKRIAIAMRAFTDPDIIELLNVQNERIVATMRAFTDLDRMSEMLANVVSGALVNATTMNETIAAAVSGALVNATAIGETIANTFSTQHFPHGDYVGSRGPLVEQTEAPIKENKTKNK